MQEILCPPGLTDRLDRALPTLFDGLSRTQARKLIAAGSVFVDGRRCRVASRLVGEGNRVRLEEMPETPAASLTILYEDENCLAVDKPAGMPSAPTRRAAAGSALDELKQLLLRRRPRRSELWLVHRLDQATSGVLLFARTRATARGLDAAFRERRVEKEYVAWVAGAIVGDAGLIDTPLRSAGPRAFADPRGQPAQTNWEVVARQADRTLVRLRPTTGRMHQLRVHLLTLGHPVVGDRLYGGPPAARLLLHAARLRFPHPATGAMVEVEAPPPRW